MAQNISVPDIGDFKDVEVIEVLIKPGDKINKNDPIVTIESDKSSLEIPSPSSGKIKDLKVSIGDKVSEGSILATIENGQTTSVPEEKKVEKIEKKISIQKDQKTELTNANAELNTAKAELLKLKNKGDDPVIAEKQAEIDKLNKSVEEYQKQIQELTYNINKNWV